MSPTFLKKSKFLSLIHFQQITSFNRLRFQNLKLQCAITQKNPATKEIESMQQYKLQNTSKTTIFLINHRNILTSHSI